MSALRLVALAMVIAAGLAWATTAEAYTTVSQNVSAANCSALTSFTAPTNTVSFDFTLSGGGGAGGMGDTGGSRFGGAGGAGSRISGTQTISGGSSVWVRLGCGGGTGGYSQDCSPGTQAGGTGGVGFVNGANGGSANIGIGCYGAAGGGGGGGTSAICADATCASPIARAGGGGGGGGYGGEQSGTAGAGGAAANAGSGTTSAGIGAPSGGAGDTGSTTRTNGTSKSGGCCSGAGGGGGGAGITATTGGIGGDQCGNGSIISGSSGCAARGGGGGASARAASVTGASFGTGAAGGASRTAGTIGYVTITWRIGTPPTGSNQTTAAATPGTPLVIALANADGDGNDRTCSVVTGPTQGSVGLSGAAPSTNCTATYTAGNSATVGDSFTYRVTDTDGLQSATYTVTIPITRTTSTAISCTSPFPWNGSSTCTVTVTDGPIVAVTPTGTMTMGAVGDDVTPSFSACTLAQLSPGVGRCTSTFTADLQDTYAITATFPATSTHTSSFATTGASMRSRLTSTVVDCSPNTVSWGSPTTCTATVTDVMSGTKVAPAGSVTFGQSGGGTFDFPTCELSPISAEASVCTADFTPTSAGNKTVNASYAGGTSGAVAGGFTHASSTAAPVPVVATGTSTPTRHSTSSTASCTPNPVPAGSPTTCTVTVTDTFTFGPTATPVGLVTWGYSGGGAFSPSNTCALVELTAGVSASCTVTFTPAAPAGNKTVNATYAGTASFFPSATGSVLVVATAPVTPQPTARRATTTGLTCAPSTQVGVGAGCLVTVTDVNPSPGPRSEPTGTVTFGFSGGGSLDPVTCTLVSNGDGQSSSCGTSYTPTSVGNKTVIASFNGTPLHKPSGSGSVFIVATP